MQGWEGGGACGCEDGGRRDIAKGGKVRGRCGVENGDRRDLAKGGRGGARRWK